MILNKDCVGDLERLQGLCVFSQNFTLLMVSVGKFTLSLVSSQLPLRSGAKLSGSYWQKVLDWVAKDDHSRGEFGIPVRCVL